jgi:hypothetical protein
MPKKGGKSAAPVDDEETIKRKSKRIKEIMEHWYRLDKSYPKP